ncbi:DedA family protein [Croceicoccus sediminis]|uniref:DedA family protein n=1 Tax=Croceicoccus sediminis TaxID=2571150 RepID=UPI0011825404|nr:DedA family protein [Croceicoccus sediminis]
MQIEQFLAQYGLWALGAGAGLEGETATILGGMLVHRGLFSFIPAVLAASLGSFLADQFFFTLGRRFRDSAYVRKVSARPGFKRALLVFERHPVGFVFAFRFLYGLRTISPLAIGTTNLRGSRFAIINAAAALLWGVIFVTLGYFFGQAIEALFGRVHLSFVVLAVLAALALFVMARSIVRRMNARRR